jgi:hypothetical protein
MSVFPTGVWIDWGGLDCLQSRRRQPQEETTLHAPRRSMSPNLPAAAALVELRSTRIASNPGHPIELSLISFTIVENP